MPGSPRLSTLIQNGPEARGPPVAGSALWATMSRMPTGCAQGPRRQPTVSRVAAMRRAICRSSQRQYAYPSCAVLARLSYAGGAETPLRPAADLYSVSVSYVHVSSPMFKAPPPRTRQHRRRSRERSPGPTEIRPPRRRLIRHAFGQKRSSAPELEQHRTPPLGKNSRLTSGADQRRSCRHQLRSIPAVRPSHPRWSALRAP